MAGSPEQLLEGSVEHLFSASAAQQVHYHLLPILLLEKHHVPVESRGVGFQASGESQMMGAHLKPWLLPKQRDGASDLDKR